MKCVICNPAMFVPTRDGWPSARQQLSLTWFGWAQNDERTRRNRSDVDHVRPRRRGRPAIGVSTPRSRYSPVRARYLAAQLCFVSAPAGTFSPRAGRVSVRAELLLDFVSKYSLSPGDRRHFTVAGAAHNFSHAAVRVDLLEIDSRACKRIFHYPSRSRNWTHRRIRRA